MPTYNKDKEAIARLTPEQFRVTQENATERPFHNAFWDHDEPGIYVDVVSGGRDRAETRAPCHK